MTTEVSASSRDTVQSAHSYMARVLRDPYVRERCDTEQLRAFREAERELFVLRSQLAGNKEEEVGG
jgi:hypothetical protein